jgi:hypothetical protein
MFRRGLLWNGDSLGALGTFSLAPFGFIGNANHRAAELAIEFDWHRTSIISVEGFWVAQQRASSIFQ